MSSVGIIHIHIYMRDLVSPVCELDSSLDPYSRMIVLVAFARMSPVPTITHHSCYPSIHPFPL